MRFWKTLIMIILAGGLFACTNAGENDPIERADGAEVGDAVQEDIQLEADAAFLENFSQHTLFSIAAAEMAMEKANNPEVKKLAEEMHQDHQMLINEMKELARTNKIPVRAGMTEDLLDELEELQEAEGAAFDEMYLNSVLEYHAAIDEEAEALVGNSKIEPIMDFSRRVTSQNYVHQNRAKQLMEQLES